MRTPSLVDLLLRLTAFALVMLVASLIQRRAPARWHCRWLATGLVGLLMLPAVYGFSGWIAPNARLQNLFVQSALHTQHDDRSAAADAAAVTAIWLCGTVAILIRLIVIDAHAALRRSRSTVVTDPRLLGECSKICAALEITLPVEIRALEDAGGPLAVRLPRPTLYLPIGIGRMPRSEQRATLLVALGLLERNRSLDVLRRIACAVYWFHPIVWLTSARLRHMAMIAADDRTLGAGCDPRRYAQAVYDVHTRAEGSGWAGRFITALALRSRIDRRVHAILDRGRPRGSGTIRAPLWLVAVPAMVLVVAASLPCPAVGRRATTETAATIAANEAHGADLKPAAAIDRLRSRLVHDHARIAGHHASSEPNASPPFRESGLRTLQRSLSKLAHRRL